MIRFYRLATCVVAVLQMASCGRSPPPGGPKGNAAAPPAAAQEQLTRIVEKYWDERVPSESALSPQSMADALSVERRFLAEANAVPRERLDLDGRLTVDMFKRQREEAIEGFTYPSELLPINPFNGVPLTFAAAAAGLQTHPLSSAAEYATWLKRIDGYTAWTRQAMENMRDGIRRGYTSPRPIIERMLPILENLSRDDAGNVFYTPLRSMPDSIKEPDRTRLTQELKQAITAKLLPANHALLDFLRIEYLPRARTTLALSALPLGGLWYAYRIKRATGSPLAPAEIHRIGLAEVERVHAQQQSVPAAAAAVAAAPDVPAAYHEVAAQVRAAMPDLFVTSLQSNVDIQASGFIEEPGSPLALQRPASRGGPAVLYVSPKAPGNVSVAEYLRLGEPGGYYLLSLQQSRGDLPRFRRFGADPSFVAGWESYAVTIGEEMGLYADETAKQDALRVQMRCAVALVVDTGLHALGWTRQQALDYLRAHLTPNDVDNESLIDGFTAAPGDALGCKLAEIRFHALKVHAQQVLGARFEIRDFHAEILKNGIMPLDMLDAQIKAWIETAR